jgi:hypothetical protein
MAARARIASTDREEQVEQAKAEVERASGTRKTALRLVRDDKPVRKDVQEALDLAEQVRPLLLSGLTVNEVAKKLGHSVYRVQAAKDRLGLTKRMNRDPFKRIADAASEYGDSLRDMMSSAEAALPGITALQARSTVSALDGLMSVIRGVQSRLKKEAANR